MTAVRGAYRWAILAAAFVAQMLAIGSTSFGFGLFVKPVAAELGLSRAGVNVGLMLLLTGMALAAPLVGRALDRLPARWIMLAGAILFGAGAATVAATANLWLMGAAIFLPLAFGTTALGPVFASAVVARWFDHHRGRALGIVAIATSAGGMLVTPALSWLIQARGWRGAVALDGLGIAAVTALLALAVIRERADADPRAPARAADPAGIGTLLRTRDFWLLAIAVGLMFAMSQALLSALVAYGTDRGFSIARATGLVTAVSLSSIVGKLAFGLLADVVDKRWLFAAVAVLLDIFLAILLGRPDYPVLLAGCLLAGATIGGTFPAWSAITSARFGVASLGTAMGFSVPVQLPAQLLAVRFIGASYDRTGSYDTAFAVFALIAPLVVVMALALGRPGWRRL